MPSPNLRTIPHTLDQVPDFARFREQAHQERTKAINMAFASIWRRISCAGSIRERDARFWQA